MTLAAWLFVSADGLCLLLALAMALALASASKRLRAQEYQNQDLVRELEAAQYELKQNVRLKPPSGGSKPKEPAPKNGYTIKEEEYV